MAGIQHICLWYASPNELQLPMVDPGLLSIRGSVRNPFVEPVPFPAPANDFEQQSRCFGSSKNPSVVWKLGSGSSYWSSAPAPGTVTSVPPALVHATSATPTASGRSGSVTKITLSLASEAGISTSSSSKKSTGIFSSACDRQQPSERGSGSDLDHARERTSCWL
jgi:hypothetical protein